MSAPAGPTDSLDTTYDLRILEGSLQKWQRSAALRCVYGEIWGDVREYLRSGPTLEIGSGIGLAKAFLPELTTSDVQKTIYVDRAASAYDLAAEKNQWANVVAMDVLHHLREPLRFLEAAAGALKPGGRVVLVEPAASPWGKVFYRLAHHEPCLPAEITPPFDFSTGVGEFANMGMGWSLFFAHRNEVAARLAASGLAIEAVCFRDVLAYPLTGGFSKPALAPAWVLKAILAAECRLPQAILRKIGLRMLVCLTRVTG